MKSKLTLRIDEEVKEEAKTLAHERGESLSGMVEAYFRLLSARQQGGSDQREGDESEKAGRFDEKNLGSITRRIAGGLHTSDRPDEETDSGSSLHGRGKEEDRRAVLTSALKKHE